MASDAVGLKQPSTPAEKAAVINNVGFLLHDAFTHAKRLGIKTALGTESPLAFEPGNAQVNDEGDPAHIIAEDWIRTCPSYVRDRMKHVHGFAIPTSRGPDNEAFAKALYEGMFTRIMRTHPLDYFWLWTYEMWAYGGHAPSRDQIESVADDFKYAQQVMKELTRPSSSPLSDGGLEVPGEMGRSWNFMMIFPWRFLLERCGMMRRGCGPCFPQGAKVGVPVGMRKTGG